MIEEKNVVLGGSKVQKVIKILSNDSYFGVAIRMTIYEFTAL